jgi:hypothetical protein
VVSLETTTSRVEGFFGNLKVLLDHEIKPILESARAVRILAEIAMKRSSSLKILLLPDILMDEDEQNLLGLYARNTLEAEYTLAVSEGDPEMSSLFMCCRTCGLLHLPCCQQIRRRFEAGRIPLFSIDDIPARWRRPEQCPDTIEDEALHAITQATPEDESEEKWGYSEILARFEPFLSLAHHRTDVQEILKDTEERLKAETTITAPNIEAEQIEIRDPPTIAYSGRRDTHPAKNSPLSGTPKRKRVYRCSRCGRLGHNKAGSPQKTI